MLRQQELRQLLQRVEQLEAGAASGGSTSSRDGTSDREEAREHAAQLASFAAALEGVQVGTPCCLC
jgi:hypothetical protein